MSWLASQSITFTRAIVKKMHGRVVRAGEAIPWFVKHLMGGDVPKDEVGHFRSGKLVIKRVVMQQMQRNAHDAT